MTSASGLERKDQGVTAEVAPAAPVTSTTGVDFTAAPSAAPGFPTLQTSLAPAASSVGGTKLAFSFSTAENRMAQIAKQAAAKGVEGTEAKSSSEAQQFSPLTPAFMSYVEKEKEKQQSAPTALSPSEQKTGLEDEETILQVAEMHLHQLNEDKSGWSERGIGIIKINKDSKGAHRLLMWRDKTHSLLLNESLTEKTFKLSGSMSARAFSFTSASTDGSKTHCIKIKKPQCLEAIASLQKKLTEILDGKTEETKTESKE